MIERPSDVATALECVGEYRAGGTDLQARRRFGISSGDLVDLRSIPGLAAIDWEDGGARLGAMVRITTLATDGSVRRHYPALSATAGSLATPQVRAVGTLGGNILQHTRCPYYRHPLLSCLKSGGLSCPARDGDHPNGVIFDLGPCVAPHPSSLAMALLVYDAHAHIAGGPDRTVAALLGNGSDGTRDHQLEAGALLTGVTLPAPDPHEIAAYHRITGRVLAEWPIVEAVCRLTVLDGTIREAAVAAGGVAPVPLRLPSVEAALVDVERADSRALEGAALQAGDGASPLPMTRHKPDLLVAAVSEVLHQAGSSHSGELALGEQAMG